MSLETGVFRLVEEPRHDRGREDLRLVNLERAPVREPRHHRLLPLRFDLVEHAVELEREWIVDAASRAALALLLL